MGQCFGHDEDEQDPHTGLTKKEMKAIKTTWNIFQENHSTYAPMVFVELFTLYPAYKILFKELRHLDATSLAMSPKLINHATAIVYRMTAFVETMHDPAVLLALVRKNGNDHTVRKGVTPLHFMNFVKLLKDAIARVSAEKMDKDANTGWDKLLTFVVNGTAQAYVEAGLCTLDTAFTGVVEKEGAKPSSSSKSSGAVSQASTSRIPKSKPGETTTGKSGFLEMRTGPKSKTGKSTASGKGGTSSKTSFR